MRFFSTNRRHRKSVLLKVIGSFLWWKVLEIVSQPIRNSSPPMQGKLDSNGNISSLGERKFSYHRRASFPSFLMTKPVITQGTSKYQMKDRDVIFLLIPVKYFGYYRLLSKSDIFFKFSKTVVVFQKTAIWRLILVCNQSQMQLRLSSNESSSLITQIAFEL